MYRITLSVLLCIFFGCTRDSVPNAKDPESRVELEDGGEVENPNRERAQSFLAALSKVKSAEEEKKQLTQFGEWLESNGYKIRVELKNGKHELSCPYFPPETPWASHSFLDIENLNLLPRIQNDG